MAEQFNQPEQRDHERGDSAYEKVNSLSEEERLIAYKQHKQEVFAKILGRYGRNMALGMPAITAFAAVRDLGEYAFSSEPDIFLSGRTAIALGGLSAIAIGFYVGTGDARDSRRRGGVAASEQECDNGTNSGC